MVSKPNISQSQIWFTDCVRYLWCIPGVCVFVEEPGDQGDVYTILGEPLYIPCVTDTGYNTTVWWSHSELNGNTTRIGDSISGIHVDYQQYYEEEEGNTPRKNFTLKIKSVRLDEPQVSCDVEVPGSPPKSVRSSWSAITVVGKLWNCGTNICL